jgi:hypothetical protein
MVSITSRNGAKINDLDANFLTAPNSYLYNKLGNVIFFRIRHGIFDRDVSREKSFICCESFLS